MTDKNLIEQLVSLSRDLYHQTLTTNKLSLKESARKLLDFVNQHQINPIVSSSFLDLSKQAYIDSQNLSLGHDLTYKLYQLALQLQIRFS